jgi:hypothetical protein
MRAATCEDDERGLCRFAQARFGEQTFRHPRVQCDVGNALFCRTNPTKDFAMDSMVAWDASAVRRQPLGVLQNEANRDLVMISGATR